MNKLCIGAVENLYLPDFDLHLDARIDTGAKTSALHVESLSIDDADDTSIVHFELLDQGECKQFSCPVVATRQIKSSNGESETRPVIQTPLALNESQWLIEITLSRRDNMTYPMLMGREAMGERMVVDPAAEFLLTQPALP